MYENECRALEKRKKNHRAAAVDEQSPFKRYEKTYIKINNPNIMESNVSMPLSLTTVACQPMKLCELRCVRVWVCVSVYGWWCVFSRRRRKKIYCRNATGFLFRFAHTKQEYFLLPAISSSLSLFIALSLLTFFGCWLRSAHKDRHSRQRRMIAK